MGEQPNISEAQLRTVMNARRLFRRSLTTISAMSTSAATSSPFSNAVVGAMRKLYPEALADKSFDNTGLLLEAPERSNARLARSALLTIDLTQAVAEEAIKGQLSIVISYHPIIFRALKSLTLANTQQNSLLRLASEGISVYSPHTAVDAAPGGLNDWLADIITMTSEHTSEHTRKIINTVPNLANLPDQFSSAGYGRIVTLSEPQAGVSVAVPQEYLPGQRSDIPIKTIGICAGSGGSMLNGLDVDLLFTGELSHHEALAAVEAGRCVVTAFHSNSERAFLEQRMVPALRKTS